MLEFSAYQLVWGADSNKEKQRMSTETPIVETVTAKAEEHVNGGNPVVKAMRNMLMAAIGTVTMGIEEVEAIINHLIERGELAEKDGRAMVTEVRERRQKDAEKTGSRFDGLVDRRVKTILNRMNIPSRGDVEDLGNKIGELSNKVDELTKKLAA